jgi:hypothetical protein
MLIQAFRAKPGIERLDARVVCRRPRPAEGQLDALLMRPCVPRLGRELWSIIDKEDFGQPVRAAQPLEHGYHTLTAQGAIDPDR